MADEDLEPNIARELIDALYALADAINDLNDNIDHIKRQG